MLGLLRRSGSGARPAAVIAALALSMTATACGSDSASDSPDAEELTKVRVVLGNSTVIGFHHVYWAQEKGIFKENGLDVDVIVVDGGEPVVQALASNQADITESTTASLLPTAMKNSDFEVEMFDVVYTRSLFDLYVPADSSIEQASDLEGKTVGIGTPDGAEAARATEILATGGLEVGPDVEFLAVGPGGQALAALERGDIDAYAGSLPDAALLAGQGVELRSLTPSDLESQAAFGHWVTMDARERLGDDALDAWVASMRTTNEQVGTDASALVDLAREIRPEEAENEDVASAMAEQFLDLKSFDGPADEWGIIDPDDWARWWDRAAAAAEVDPAASNADDYFTNDFTE